MTAYRYTHKANGTVHTVNAGASASMARDALAAAIVASMPAREGKIISKATTEHTDDGNWIEAIDHPGRGFEPTGRAVSVVLTWATTARTMATERHDAGSRAASKYFAKGGLRGW